jgi:hypothetical protein
MKVTVCRDNRTFEAYVNSLGLGLAEVSFYEVVRPTWKIFRTKFFPFDSNTFFVDDYETILLAVQDCLRECLADEAHDKERVEKWKSFEKDIDKMPKV